MTAAEITRRFGRSGAATALVAITGLWSTGAAHAHIDPEPKEAQAGSTQSIGFTVQHGCDGSPTTQLDMRLPEGVGGVVPEPPEGWQGTVDGDVVTFIGGPLPDDVELTFRVSMTLPRVPDVTVYFPFVQRCEVGEIRWIDLPSDGGQLEEPAPALLLVGPVAAPPTTPPATDPAATEPPTTTSSTSTAPVATQPPTTQLDPPATEPSVTEPAGTTTTGSDSSDGGSSTGLVVGAVVVVLLVAGGAAVAVTRRRRS